MTLAVRERKDGSWTLGGSFCSPLDLFIRKSGARRSLGRALSVDAPHLSAVEDEESLVQEAIENGEEHINDLSYRRWTSALIKVLMEDPGWHNVELRTKDGNVVWSGRIGVGVWE